MIRLEENDTWLLLGHAEHARLAGEFARHWKNERFSTPEPFAHILDAVSRHDDSWTEVDAKPSLTPEREPAAFSRELVGTYDAFEDIDLDGYLSVRGRATEAAAARDPYAAILISMHTVNLLTEQADPSELSTSDTEVLNEFVAGQRSRQAALKSLLLERGFSEEQLGSEALQWGFEFLQACDSLSLLIGVDYPTKSVLRHAQKTRDGKSVEVVFRPEGDATYSLDPYPLDEDPISFQFSYRRLPRSATESLASFQQAYTEAELEQKTIHLRSRTS